MRPGLVGTVLLVVAGGAAGGALYLKDQSKLQAADESRDQGLRLLESGDEQGARQAFRDANLAASHVSGLTGLRRDALETIDTSRRSVETLDALALAEEHPRTAARLLADRERLPARAGEVLSEIQSRLLLDSAQALEQSGAVQQALRAYALAVASAREVDASHLATAERGQRRASLLEDLRKAEIALRTHDEAGAKRLAVAARANLRGAESPFADPRRVEELRARIDAIMAEVADHFRLASYEEKVDKLYGKVNSPALGALLSVAKALKAPVLKGGYAGKAAREKRLRDLKLRHGRVLRAAREFQGMVFAKRTEGVSVFVDKTEVTGAAYMRFVSAGGYAKKELWSSEGLRRLKLRRFLDRDAKDLGPKVWRKGRPPKGWGKRPVTGVSYFEAEAYAKWRGKRLPTASEWRAAAATQGQAYPWGDTYEKGRANVRGERGRLMPVGSYRGGAGPTGALDMIGNAREIVRAGAGKYDGLGGSYKTLPERAKVEKRMSVPRSLRATDTGFRCAKELRWDG